MFPRRYGKREGFENLKGKQLHDVGVRFQQVSPVSLHENVPGYDEAGWPYVKKWKSWKRKSILFPFYAKLVHIINFFWISLPFLRQTYLKKNLKTHDIEEVQLAPEFFSYSSQKSHQFLYPTTATQLLQPTKVRPTAVRAPQS